MMVSKSVFAGVIALILLGGPLSAEGDPTYGFSPDDPGMNAAMAGARDTLDAFIANTMVDGQSGAQTMIKVAIPTDDGNEIIWIAPFAQLSATGWVGVLANQPQMIAGANAGDTVEFAGEQIADWALFGDDGLLYGGYTLREMVASGAVTEDAMPPMSGDPVPQDW